MKKMKKIFLIVLFLCGALGVQAQQLYWETDVNKAIIQSSKTKKPLLMFFTGSDWCGWCVRLQKEVLTTSEFATWAKKNVVLVELDFPKGKSQPEAIKKQNNSLQNTFGVQGFPTVFIVNVAKSGDKINFNALGKTGYVAGGPKSWLAEADKILKNK